MSLHQNRWIQAITLFILFLILIGLWYVALRNSYYYDREHVEECWCGHVHYHSMNSEKEHVEYEND